MNSCLEQSLAIEACASDGAVPARVALLTGGFDRPYAYGLAMALAGHGVALEIVGSSDVDSPEFHSHPRIRFLNLYGNRSPKASAARKFLRVLAFYVRLLGYLSKNAPPVVHILWNNKFAWFDRTLLMLYIKLLGKRVVFTAHNVNAGKRDGNDSRFNRFTLRAQYRLADHIFVHTDRMKAELEREFEITPQHVSVIPFGVNNSVPDTALDCAGARRQLGLADEEKAILFFGAIRAYKGLEYLVDAFAELAKRDRKYRLIIAGEPKKQDATYLAEVRRRLARCPNDQVLERFAFIPDEETEIYFKAADVTVLPYTHIFQSGVLLLAYGFGLPAIATRVGSFEDDIREGVNGFLCEPCDAGSLAGAIERFFESNLFSNAAESRRSIRRCARELYSWNTVACRTMQVYSELSAKKAIK